MTARKFITLMFGVAALALSFMLGRCALSVGNREPLAIETHGIKVNGSKLMTIDPGMRYTFVLNPYGPVEFSINAAVMLQAVDENLNPISKTIRVEPGSDARFEKEWNFKPQFLRIWLSPEITNPQEIQILNGKPRVVRY